MNELNSGFEQDRARTLLFSDLVQFKLARKKGGVAGTNNIEHTVPRSYRFMKNFRDLMMYILDENQF